MFFIEPQKDALYNFLKLENIVIQIKQLCTKEKTKV